MSPTLHALVAGSLGIGVYKTTGSWEGGMATLAAGVLPDVDHLLDYFNWFVRRDTRRLFYLLHGWEYLGLFLLIAAVLSWPWVVAGIILGYATHIVGDFLTNHRLASFYLLTYRAQRGFRRREIVPTHLHSRFDAQINQMMGHDSLATLFRVTRSLVVRCLSLPWWH